MSSEGNHRSSFHHADTNHNGEAFSSADSAGPTETLTYEIGLDVAVAGFTQNPIEYEKYTQSANSTKGHTYGVGPDVGIGAPHVARTMMEELIKGNLVLSCVLFSFPWNISID
ncbi:unnamed protein product [Rotaria socialis]